jgi:hypothetical protein
MIHGLQLDIVLQYTLKRRKGNTNEIPVLGIRIRMFFGLPDPDPLVRGTDPNPDSAPDPSLFS